METAIRHTTGTHRFTIHNETNTIKIERYESVGLVLKQYKWIEIYNGHILSIEMALDFVNSLDK